jgi:hypothetical protein
VRKKLYRLRWQWHAQRDPKSLRNYQRKVYSQNGEDGIIEEVFNRIGTTNRFVVEFGIEDGQECNARYLVMQYGWRALLLDGWDEGVEKARERYRGHAVEVLQAFITAENIVEQFRCGKVPEEPDLVVVDIDSNDYWVLQAILGAYRPRVMMVEYNARWTPPTRWVMPYDATYVWDRSVYCGASLQSFADLGDEHGYTIVVCDRQGVNAILVRNDLLQDHFPEAKHSLFTRYMAPMYTWWFGHPVNVPPAKKPTRGLAPTGAQLDSDPALVTA